VTELLIYCCCFCNCYFES